jgi:hypothetical protein
VVVLHTRAVLPGDEVHQVRPQLNKTKNTNGRAADMP